MVEICIVVAWLPKTMRDHYLHLEIAELCYHSSIREGGIQLTAFIDAMDSVNKAGRGEFPLPLLLLLNFANAV